MLNKHAGEDVSTRVQIDVNWDDYLVTGKGLHVILQSQKWSGISREKDKVDYAIDTYRYMMMHRSRMIHIGIGLTLSAVERNQCPGHVQAWQA